MGMIKEGTAHTVQKAEEFAISRQAIGQDGEHVLLRWTEMIWDDYFNARDFDWAMTKQTEKNALCCFLIGSSIASVPCLRWRCSCYLEVLREI